ncbi:MAG: hypothetical protein ACOYOU_00825 [Kiritimatiellia bacterium]
MTWDGIVALSLYIDVTASGRNPLLKGTTSTPIWEAPILISGDKIPARLYFRSPDPAGGTSTNEDLAAGAAVIMAGKKKGAIASESTPLFLADSFSAVDPETGDSYYEGVLDLNTAEIEAAFGADEEMTVVVDVEIQALDGGISTYQFDVIIRREVADGEPGSPVSLPSSGEAAITIGALTVTIDLTDYGFTAAPRLLTQAVKPAAGSDNIFVAGLTISATQAIVELSAPPAITGYKVLWHFAR